MPEFLGSLVSYVGNRAAQERSFEMQQKLQKDQQSYNTLMWNKANDYNSPMQQMMRFQSAGLNPNLIYSQLGTGLAAPTSGLGSAPSPAQMQAPSLMETAQLGLIDAQRENIQADTDKKLADADLSKYEKWYKDNVTKFFDEANTFKIKQEGNTEYQRGLAQAIENFRNGYKPEIFKDEKGNPYFNDDRFEREWYVNQDSFEKNRQDVLDRYKLDNYDRLYLDRVFEAMVTHDKQAFDTATNELKAKSAPLKAMAENEWMQFLNYLFDKLSQPAIQLSGMLLRRR